MCERLTWEIKITLYHGTNSEYLSPQINEGYYAPSRIWVSGNPDICASRAIRKAVRHNSKPVIIQFSYPTIEKATIEPLEDHSYLSGNFSIHELSFLNRFGNAGERALQEITEQVKGAVMTQDYSNQHVRIFIPTEEEALGYLRSVAVEKAPFNKNYLDTLRKVHGWDTDAVKDLKIAANSGNDDSIEEIIRKSRKVV